MTYEDSSRLERWERRSEWPLATIALIFLAAYSFDVLAEPKGKVDHVVDAILSITYAVFVIDYAVRLALATNRGRWFFRHILDLLIVALPLLRPLRLLRVVVLVVALQRAMGGAFRGRVIVYTVSATLLLIYVASLAILEEERYVPESSITNFGDALWWSATTITTVGYGEQEPMTTSGRLIAVVLMVGGISLIGLVTATLASWIVERVAEEDEASQAATTAQINAFRSNTDEQLASLHAEIQQLKDGLNRDQPHP
jgi:voltage-gated potassium channel